MLKIVIIYSRFNESITRRMKSAAEKTAAEQGATVVAVIDVPGAFEIPFALKKILDRGQADCCVALGAVIKGETDHDRVIAETVAEKISSLSLEYKKPIGFGIIGPGVTWKQADARAEEYGRRATEAALEMT